MNGLKLNRQRPAIAPSILTADFGRLREQVQEAERAGVDLIHLDVMDGRFVPNISFGSLVVSAVRTVTSLPLDVHLMIESPERYIDAFAAAGADIITIHAEATPHSHRAIQQIKSHDLIAGVAINPATPIAAVEELVHQVDLILVMSVNPGFGGQSFIPETTGKLGRLKERLKAAGTENVLIEVDGGINRDTIDSVVQSGADICVTGSSVFNRENTVEEAIRSLRAAASSGSEPPTNP